MSASPREPPPATVVSQLDVSQLTIGKSRVLVPLVESGLGRGIELPILIMKGSRPGPVLGLTAAVHGNELNGIRVIHDVFDRLDPTTLRGTVVGVVAVNVLGLLNHERRFLGEVDLNHAMPGRANGNEAQVFVHRLLERVISSLDYLVDLHTASFGRVNSLYVRADMKNAVTAGMARLLGPQIIVHNPPSDGTLRGAAMELGIPAVTVEVGDPQRFQLNYVRRTRRGLRNVLVMAGMIPRRAGAKVPKPVICQRSYWMRASRGGLLEVLPKVTAEVTDGELVARVRNAFGDTTAEFFAPQDGVVVGRSVNPVGQTGARILHLGIPAPDGFGVPLDDEVRAKES
jgi:predicted deacylase